MKISKLSARKDGGGTPLTASTYINTPLTTKLSELKLKYPLSHHFNLCFNIRLFNFNICSTSFDCFKIQH